MSKRARGLKYRRYYLRNLYNFVCGFGDVLNQYVTVVFFCGICVSLKINF